VIVSAGVSLFLSHTTHDPRDYALAHRLADGLRARQVAVWIAPESIPPGEHWREEIVRGVMDGCSHFLVIFTAASSEAEWVLEEIQLARRRAAEEGSFKILPLVIGSLGHLSNAELVEARQSVPFHEDFHAQLDAVAEALGLRPTAPESVRTFVEERTRDFVGRAFVFDAVETFLSGNSRGYFVLEGEPGIGKSAILASFVKRTGCVAHFNVRAQGITTPRQFLQSVCAQLINRFGLPYASLPQEAADDGGFLAQLLAEAADRLEEKERLVVAVDALDEADLGREDTNVLYLPPTLPEHVYLVVSKRPVEVPLNADAPRENFDLSEHAAEGMEDVRRYIALQVAERPALRSWVASQKLEGSFVETVAQKSQGNFMYLRYILPDIELNRYPGLVLDELPAGLEAYYEDHWRRMGMTAKPLPRDRIRVVYVLSSVRRPVSRELISRFATDDQLIVDELTVQEVLDDWDQFLRTEVQDGNRVKSIYHASFRDFLHRKDVVQAAGMTLVEVNRLIADSLWEDVFE
jgi:TIR domain